MLVEHVWSSTTPQDTAGIVEKDDLVNKVKEVCDVPHEGECHTMSIACLCVPWCFSCVTLVFVCLCLFFVPQHDQHVLLPQAAAAGPEQDIPLGYVYDANSGYYFNTEAGLYYHAGTGTFYNGTAWYRWDGARYVPAQ